MLSTYLPKPSALVRETLLILVGTVAAAWIIGQVPAWQRLVRANTIPTPFDKE